MPSRASFLIARLICRASSGVGHAINRWIAQGPIITRASIEGAIAQFYRDRIGR